MLFWNVFNFCVTCSCMTFPWTAFCYMEKNTYNEENLYNIDFSAVIFPSFPLLMRIIYVFGFLLQNKLKFIFLTQKFFFRRQKRDLRLTRKVFYMIHVFIHSFFVRIFLHSFFTCFDFPHLLFLILIWKSIEQLHTKKKPLINFLVVESVDVYLALHLFIS